MAQTDLLHRLLEAGMSFTRLTQERAERIVRELVKTGELRVDEVQSSVADLLERSRKSSEELAATIQKEVARQMKAVGVATQKDLDRLERRLQAMAKPASKSSKPAKASKAPKKASGAAKAPKASAAAKAPKKASAAAKPVKAAKAVTKAGGAKAAEPAKATKSAKAAPAAPAAATPAAG